MFFAALATLKVLLGIKRVSIYSFSASANPTCVKICERSGSTRFLLPRSTCYLFSLIIIFFLCLKSDRHLSILGVKITSHVFDLNGRFALSSKDFSPINPLAEWVRPDVSWVTQPCDRVFIKHFLHQVNGIAGKVPRKIQSSLIHNVLVHFHSILVVVRRETCQQLIQKSSQLVEIK